MPFRETAKATTFQLRVVLLETVSPTWKDNPEVSASGSWLTINLSIDRKFMIATFCAYSGYGTSQTIDA
jgi:hypothetical protein